MVQNINEQIQDLALNIRKSVENYITGSPSSNKFDEKVYALVDESERFNPWHIPRHVLYALKVLSDDLDLMASSNLTNYQSAVLNNANIRLGIIMREGSPLEGIAELFFLVCSGVGCEVKNSKFFKEIFNLTMSLFDEFPIINERLQLTESKFNNIAGIISFEELNQTKKEYLKKYHLLELSTHGYSYVIGKDNDEILLANIAEMICMYFGRSNRNIKVLFTPDSFDLNDLLKELMKYSDHLFHNRYYNNYEYRKAAMIFNKIPYIPDYPVLITKAPEQAGYISVLCVQSYQSADEKERNNLLKKYPLINDPRLKGNKLLNKQDLSAFKHNVGVIYEYLKLFPVQGELE